MRFDQVIGDVLPSAIGVEFACGGSLRIRTVSVDHQRLVERDSVIPRDVRERTADLANKCLRPSFNFCSSQLSSLIHAFQVSAWSQARLSGPTIGESLHSQSLLRSPQG